MNPGGKKEGHMEEELKTDAQKRYDSRVPVEIWDRRAWAYEGDRESGVLNVLRESILRWWRRKLTREFAQLLMQSSGTWKWVVLSQGIR